MVMQASSLAHPIRHLHFRWQYESGRIHHRHHRGHGRARDLLVQAGPLPTSLPNCHFSIRPWELGPGFTFFRHHICI